MKIRRISIRIAWPRHSLRARAVAAARSLLIVKKRHSMPVAWMPGFRSCRRQQYPRPRRSTAAKGRSLAQRLLFLSDPAIPECSWFSGK
jgi:hypothetical protein